MSRSGVTFLFVISTFSTIVYAVDTATRQKIQASLESIIPDIEITDIKKSRVDGLLQVMMGTDVVYVTEDGKYALSGELYDIQNRENLTDNSKASVRKEILSRVPASEIIEFKAEKPSHAIYVFTDITCGYCRKLHRDVPVLNENGVSVRYLAFPRGGPTSGGGDQLAAVWCSKDRTTALTEAKLGKETKSESCDNPVASHYKLGADLGVRGTPAIYLEDGRAIPGYQPPEQILSVLNR